MKISQRNFGLDVLRTISIWLVLLQHSKILIIDGIKGLSIGGIGVEIFFVLSGFLIGQIIIKNLQKSNTIKIIVNFWIRRWFRILPLYYLMLLIKFIFIDNSIGSNIWYYIFFLQNNFYGIEYYEVTWSLVIEEWFYIIVPIFLFLTFKLSRKKTNIVVILFLLFILFENIIRFIYVKKFNVPYSGVNGNVIFRIDSLFYGVLLAYLKINFKYIFIKLSRLPVFIFSLVCFISYLYIIIAFSKSKLGINGFIFPRTIGFTIFPLIIAFILPFFDSKSSFSQNSILGKIYYKFITYTSLLTYSIYLIHPLVFEQLINKKPFKIVTEINLILAITLTYMIAYFLFNFFETPILKYRNKKISD